MGIMLVYDITQEKSFENIKNWIRNIEENASADVEKMLLGNKCELNERRQVSVDSLLFILFFLLSIVEYIVKKISLKQSLKSLFCVNFFSIVFNFILCRFFFTIV